MTRRGLVLGAGGVLGAAWTIGALCALQEAEGVDPRVCEVLIGTSAGSVLAALLSAGLDVDTLRNHQLGVPLPGGQSILFDHDTATGAALPPRPRLGIGSPPLLRRKVRHPRTVPAQATFWALMPQGRRTLAPLRDLVDSLVPPDAWAPREGVWLVAMDYRTGERVAFGRAGSPPAGLAQAVVASCSIPGWYAPQIIGGRPYVDGGVRSATSVDLLAESAQAGELDEVFVLAPLAALGTDRPATVAGRLERQWRRRVTRRVLREAGLVQRAGVPVTLLAPGARDLALMGTNLMDPARRTAVLEESVRTSAEVLRRR